MIDKPSIALPVFGWVTYQKTIKQIVEGKDSFEEDSVNFLSSIGFVHILAGGLVHTELCASYYDAVYIGNDEAQATTLLKEVLLNYPPAQLIIQMLRGVKNASRNNALAILKSRDMWNVADEKPLTNLLLIMNSAGLIVYSKKHGTIKVTHFDEGIESTPTHMFIDPKRPYSNKMWLTKVLRESSGHIYWIDKHFSASGLEYIWENRDANKVKKVYILSLFLDTLHGKKVLKKYNELKQELKDMGIELTWYVIDSKQIRDNHDRWIISKGVAWNLPDLNSIESGSRSEISKTPHGNEMEKAFLQYLKNSKEITALGTV